MSWKYITRYDTTRYENNKNDKDFFLLRYLVKRKVKLYRAMDGRVDLGTVDIDFKRWKSGRTSILALQNGTKLTFTRVNSKTRAPQSGDHQRNEKFNLHPETIESSRLPSTTEVARKAIPPVEPKSGSGGLSGHLGRRSARGVSAETLRLPFILSFIRWG